MRKLAFFAPMAATLAVAAMAQAQPQAQAPTAVQAEIPTPSNVTVTIGSDLQNQVKKLGEREVDEQIANLKDNVARVLQESYPGASAQLVLTDLKPNRPTMQQQRDTPGLDPIRSISVGGAAIEGQLTTADGQTQSVKFSYFSPSIRDVWGYGVWQDADRAFERFSAYLQRGRF
nr:hypothetical protein [uncultured Brevundimonas sp.]